jgi:RecA-family ATPase
MDRDAQAQERIAAKRFPKVWLNDARVDLSAPFVVKQLIPSGGLIVVYGPAGSGKTFEVIDLAGRVAAGLPWRGRRVRQGSVVYVAAEAGASILRRFVAWRDRNLSEAREARVPLVIITKPSNLLNQVEVSELLAQLKTIAEEINQPISLVVFDTVSRSIPGGDENAAKDMTLVVSAADQIRDELGAATLLVHHTGKDPGKGARGHSALFAAADTVIAVSDHVATVEKVRDGVAGEQFPFALDVIDLGTDQDGDQVTTCVVRHLNDSDQKPRKEVQRLTADETLALNALREVSAPLAASSTIPGGKLGSTVDEWRRMFYARLGESRDVDQPAKRQAFNRGKKGLLAKKLVGAWEGFAWIW